MPSVASTGVETPTGTSIQRIEDAPAGPNSIVVLKRDLNRGIVSSSEEIRITSCKGGPEIMGQFIH